MTDKRKNYAAKRWTGRFRVILAERRMPATGSCHEPNRLKSSPSAHAQLRPLSSAHVNETRRRPADVVKCAAQTRLSQPSKTDCRLPSARRRRWPAGALQGTATVCR